MLMFYGLRTDIAEAAHLPMFWGKLGFTATVAAAALFLSGRLARPGAVLTPAWIAVALPLAIIWAMSAMLLSEAAPALRAQMVLGRSWATCSLSIAALSAPIFIAAFWAMRGLAPTRLALGGAGAGLLAGALGSTIYALHCVEMEAPFLAVWYVAGMAIPAVAGALLGPRMLRW